MIDKKVLEAIEIVKGFVAHNERRVYLCNALQTLISIAEATTIRLKPLDVGEVEKLFWDIDLPEPEDMSNRAFVKSLAQAIHDHFTLPKEEMDKDKVAWICDEKLRAFPISEDMLPLKSRGIDYTNLLKTLTKALCQAYSKGLLKKE